MKKFTEKIYSYDKYHQSKQNQITHFIGVPLIIFSLLLLGSHFFLSFLHISFFSRPMISISDIGVICLIIYYLFLRSPSLYLVPTALVFFILLQFSHYMNQHHSANFIYILSTILFIVGWAFQLIGHKIEGNKPALVDNLSHIFIAPIYLISELMMKLGIKIYLS